MKNILRELITVVFVLGSMGVSAQVDLGQFDHRDSKNDPEAKRVEKEQFYDLLVEEYEAIRVTREKLKAQYDEASDSDKADIKKKLDALDKREAAADEKMENPPE